MHQAIACSGAKKYCASSEEVSQSVEEQLRHSLSQHQERMEENRENKRALKVLFLSADTGGGHRDSAESLANQVCAAYFFASTPDSNEIRSKSKIHCSIGLLCGVSTYTCFFLFFVSLQLQCITNMQYDSSKSTIQEQLMTSSTYGLLLIFTLIRH